jgi:hypothetical protein
MIHTIKLTLDSDGYTPNCDEEVINFIKETFNKTAVFVSNIEILDKKD